MPDKWLPECSRAGINAYMSYAWCSILLMNSDVMPVIVMLAGPVRLSRWSRVDRRTWADVRRPDPSCLHAHRFRTDRVAARYGHGLRGVRHSPAADASGEPSQAPPDLDGAQARPGYYGCTGDRLPCCWRHFSRSPNLNRSGGQMRCYGRLADHAVWPASEPKTGPAHLAAEVQCLVGMVIFGAGLVLVFVHLNASFERYTRIGLRSTSGGLIRSKKC